MSSEPSGELSVANQRICVCGRCPRCRKLDAKRAVEISKWLAERVQLPEKPGARKAYRHEPKSKVRTETTYGVCVLPPSRWAAYLGANERRSTPR
jgi:hypothetical protein